MMLAAMTYEMDPAALRAWRQRLKSNRGRRNVSMAEAAERLRVPYRTYQDWEREEARIPGVVALACAAVERGLPPIDL